MDVSKPLGFESIANDEAPVARSPREDRRRAGKRDVLSERRKVVVPGWYSPVVHFISLLAMTFVGIAVVWRHTSLAEVRPAAWLAVVAALLFANGLEYVVHRFPMHKRNKRLDRLFTRHTMSHHRWFTDERMEIKSLKEMYMVFFEVELVYIVVAIVAAANFGLRMTIGADVGALFSSALLAYWLALELVHAASHLPKSWYAYWPLRGPVLRYLCDFHQSHHDPRLMRKGNFNVVFPLFDFMFGTALPRRRYGSEAPE